MFTGLIQCIGVLRGRYTRGSGATLSIMAPAIFSKEDPLILGESIAVNGACLTVSHIYSDGFEANVLEETLKCTMFSKIVRDNRVNLERALRVGERLGGHFVSGHVDEVGTLLERRPVGCDFIFRIGCSQTFANGTIRKGSVALSGVSLTVSDVGTNWFEVALIPTTLRETTLGLLSPGEPLNLEADIIGLYVRQALGHRNLSLEQLIAAGFTD